VALIADALGIVRLAAAVATPPAVRAGLDGSGAWWLPVALWVVAAGSDFVDGRIARAAGHPTRHGAVLDNVADIAFVVAATSAGAVHGLVSWTAPLTMAAAFAAYAVASVRGGERGPSRSRVGHAGGVLNYALAGSIAGAVAWPGTPSAVACSVGSALVVAVNGAALAVRLVPREPDRRARVPPVGGSTVRSRHSSA
jgi:phosphatidylglycerophosphate synthase